MVRPRGKFRRSRGFSPGLVVFHEIESFNIAAWCPDGEAKTRPVQVHLVLSIKGFPAPVVMRFKSPDTLGFIIEELACYRREVWPDAESLDLSGKPDLDGTADPGGYKGD